MEIYFENIFRTKYHLFNTQRYNHIIRNKDISLTSNK